MPYSKRNHVSSLLLFLLLVLAFPPAQATAQEPDRVSAVQQLQLGQRLRLDMTTLGTIEGRFVSTDGTGVTVFQDGGQQELPVADIERLWVRGSSARKGAVIGGAVGLAVGVIGGLLVAQVACEPVDGGDCTSAEVATVLGLAGCGTGALIGLGIGFSIPAWHLRFP